MISAYDHAPPLDPDVADLLDTPPPPGVYRSLWDWLYLKLGLKLAVGATCPGHTAPYDIMHYKYANTPHTSIVHGPRGGGKSMMAGIGAHLRCRWNPGYRVKILGGSRQQSAQVYEALTDRVVRPPNSEGDSEPFARRGLMRESASYRNGSSITILAASSRSARGPHAPHLILDEVDEQDRTIMDAAVGIVQEYKDRGFAPMLEMLSTWHRIGGPMGERMERAAEEKTPVFKYCIFEVMDECPDEISGPRLENCPSCPIYGPCWADRLNDRRKPPRAKQSRGHYTVRTVLQKALNVTLREFEADYLCLAPRAEGVWFMGFHDTLNVDADRAEFVPELPIHISIDYGVHTAAVFFQVKTVRHKSGPWVENVAIFGEYFAESKTPEENAVGIRAVADRLCNGRLEDISMDSAARSREGAGKSGQAEYYKAGLPIRRFWRKVQSKAEDTRIIESFIQNAAGSRHLFVHPRCVGMRRALLQYRRAKSRNQWLDHPADPQHPEEEYIDALAGGLNLLYPGGRVNIHKGRSIIVPGNRLA